MKRYWAARLSSLALEVFPDTISALSGGIEVACRVVARARNGASRKDVRLRRGYGATVPKAFGTGTDALDAERYIGPTIVNTASLMSVTDGVSW